MCQTQACEQVPQVQQVQQGEARVDLRGDGLGDMTGPALSTGWLAGCKGGHEQQKPDSNGRDRPVWVSSSPSSDSPSAAQTCLAQCLRPARFESTHTRLSDMVLGHLVCQACAGLV